MNIGKNIQDLRKKNHFTQEQLANAVGVSTPAVSKWENGASLPDVALLAPIARFLKTDMNDLMQFRQNLSDTEVNLTVERVKEVFEKEGFDSGLQEAQQLVSEFPNCNYLKVNLVTAIRHYDKKRGTSYDPKQLPDYLLQCEAWLLHVHEHPEVDDHPIVPVSCLSMMTMLYKDMGQLYKMEDILTLEEAQPDYTLMLSQIYLMQHKLDEAEALFKKKASNHIFNAVADIRGLCNIYIEREDYERAAAYAEDYYKFTSSVPAIYCIPSEAHLEVAIHQGNTEAAIQYLKASVEEMNDSERDVVPPRYQQAKTEGEGGDYQVWSTDYDNSEQHMFIKNLEESDKGKVFMELKEVQEILGQLK